MIFYTEEHLLCGVVATPGALHYSYFPDLQQSHLMTDRSYEKNFLKEISIQTIIKISLQFYFEVHWEPHAQVLIITTSFAGKTFVIIIIIMQQKDKLSESPSTCWSVCVPPPFVFSNFN